MKKLFLGVAFLAILGCSQEASAHAVIPAHGHETENDKNDLLASAGVDAPNLIRISENWTFGTEVTKGLTNTDISEDWAILGKFTFGGTLYDARKTQ
jgi:hypothetical protein